MGNNGWRALDHCDTPESSSADVEQTGEQVNVSEQQSFEIIIVRNSEDVDVITTDTQAAVSLQLGIQAAIAAVVIATIGDNEQGRAVVQDIRQFTRNRQRNVQRTIIDGCKNVSVTTTDTDLAVNIQALLQILVAIIVKLDIL